MYICIMLNTITLLIIPSMPQNIQLVLVYVYFIVNSFQSVLVGKFMNKSLGFVRESLLWVVVNQ